VKTIACQAAQSRPPADLHGTMADDERAAAELAICASEAFLMCEFYRRPTAGQIPIGAIALDLAAALADDDDDGERPRTWELLGHCLCGGTTLTTRTTATAHDEHDARIVSVWFRLMLALDLAYRDPGLWICKRPACLQIFDGIAPEQLAAMRAGNADEGIAVSVPNFNGGLSLKTDRPPPLPPFVRFGDRK
jgi:hypothetical protein